jgi:hypothetical protein
MADKKTKHGKPASHPASSAGLDSTESGPTRLYAPGKPREVEAGPARVRANSLRRDQTGGVLRPAYTSPRSGADVDATEAGPARLTRIRK